MEVLIKVYQDKYYDSVQLMFVTSSLKKYEGVTTALVAMGTPANKEIFNDIGMKGPEIEGATANDMIIGIGGSDAQVCQSAIDEANRLLSGDDTEVVENKAYPNLDSAIKANKKANLCMISVPGDYAKIEAMKALKAGLNTLIFSDNVPLEDEREIKLFAKEKGLICMGPDCGVTNLNGISFLVGSIVDKGPIGICAASGVGLQQAAVLIHESGSGVSQGIGTGGKDLKDAVGGLTMLAGIDALERDHATKIILLISRKPEPDTLQKILDRVEKCNKPVVICFMGCEAEEIIQSGAVYAHNLEAAAAEALSLVGIEFEKADEEEMVSVAKACAEEMSSDQKYIRGLFCGGTFVEETMVTMKEDVGEIYSNAPLDPSLMLEDSKISYKNSVVDYGGEEFTLSRPHPVIDLEPRVAGIMREAQDPETAVILLDFVLGPAVNQDPVGAIIDDIKKAMFIGAQKGGKLTFVASVCGTEADPQKRSKQETILKDARVIVCPDNYQAALLAGKIIKSKKERDNDAK